MRKILSFTILALFLGSLFVRGGSSRVDNEGVEAPKKELIDIKADIVFPHKVTPDSSVLCLVGNFAAQHNGTIITADSAVRYSDDRIECFGNVLINKNTTYAYADRADYNGAINEVTLFSPLIKVVDEDVTLYTYNFSFNTLDNIGIFDGGAIAFNQDSSRLESLRGYYYADDKEIIGVEDVEIHTKDYDMKGDSVKYNMSTDYAEFYEKSNIWNSKGEYLYTDEGNYDKEFSRFSFTRDGYILTKEQEVWSDSLDYFSDIEEAILRNNIQIDDTTNKVLAWGDYGRYWGGELERAMLSKNPSVVSYNTEQGDSLFMRADTIILTTFNADLERRKAKAQAEAERAEALAAQEQARLEMQLAAAAEVEEEMETEEEVTLEEEVVVHEEEVAHSHDHDHDHDHDHQHPEIDELEHSEPEQEVSPIESLKSDIASELDKETISAEIQSVIESSKSELPQQYVENIEEESLQLTDSLLVEVVDSLRPSFSGDSTQMEIVVDSLAQDSVKVISPAEQKALDKEKAKALKAEAKRIKADSASIERIRKNAIKLDAAKAREARKAAARKAKIDAKRIKRGEIIESDSLTLDSLMLDSLMLDSLMLDSMMLDSLGLDSLGLDSLSLDSLMVDSLAMQIEVAKPDSIYRIITAYRNNKTYREDFQSISDSLYTDSRDTTLHMYHSPILWNSANQITSDVMDIYSLDGELSHAVFTGTPIMASQVNRRDFNQVTGKTMTSLFRNNEIYRNEVDGNVQTIYYAEDEETFEVTTMAYIESGSATFYISNQDLDAITYRSNPNYIFYPIEMIPESQPLTLKGFEWQIAKRPSRKDFTDRERRPSQREAKEALPRPTFPIDQGIRIEIEQLIKDRKWMDRTDVVAPHAEEWLETLGYKSGQPRSEE